MPDAVVIAPLLPEPPVTGGQKRTLRLLEAMAASGLTPHILSEQDAPADAVARLTERGWTVELLPEPAPSLAARLAQHARRLPSPYLHRTARRLAQLDPALLQLEHTQSAYYTANAPTVLSLHNIDSELAASGAGRDPRQRHRAHALATVERRAIPRADRVLAVSEHDKAAVERLGGHAILAPNGVDDAFFGSTPPPRNRTVLFFGHFGYQANARGIARFVEQGWPALKRTHPDARLWLAGAGLTDALRATFPRDVEVLGLVDDLAATLARAAAVVVPIWEGGGTRLKVLEALAAARPVVSTTLGAEGIGFVHGRHGLLADTPAALAAALGSVLDEPGELPAHGQALARRFRWAETLSGVSAYYAEIRASWTELRRR